MDEAWRRVKSELDGRGRTLIWLADRLGCRPQRVYNWQARTYLPKSVYPEVSAVLGKSPNWLAGLDEAGDVLSPMEQQIVRAFGRIEDQAAQMAAFVQIIEVCARASDGRHK